MGYQTVRALIPIRHSGVLRVPGVATGDNAQDFIVDDAVATKLIGSGYVTSQGVSSAPSASVPKAFSVRQAVDLATLTAKYPAADNLGNVGLVGVTAPYTRYYSDGSVWAPAGASSSAAVAVAVAQKLDASASHLGGIVALAQNATYTLTPDLDYSKGVMIEGPATGVGNLLCGAGVTINGSSRSRRLPPGSVVRLHTISGNALAMSIVQADPIVPRAAFRVVAGNIDTSGAVPHQGRILTPKTSLPAMLWEPANLAMPGTPSNCTAAANRNYVCRSQYGSVGLTASASGSVAATWTGQNVNFALAISQGYTTGVIYLFLPHLMESMTISFSGSGGRQRILTYNFACARKGLVALPFALPGLSAPLTTSVNNALLGVNIAGMSEFNGGFDVNNTTVTSIGVTFSTFGMAGTTVSAGEVFAVAGIDLLPKLRPAVLVTYDKVNGTPGQDSFNELVDLHRVRNLAGGVRYYGLYDNNGTGLGFIKYGTDRGFDVFNGTLTRQPTSGQTVADAYREFGLNDTQMRASGLVPTAFHTVPGNASWPDGTYEQIMASIGVRYSRATGLPVIPHGFGGMFQPYCMGTTGMTSPNGKTPTQYLQGLVDAGVHGSIFSHGIFVGTDPGDSRNPVADVVATLDALKAFQDAGLIDVVGCDGMSLILDGLA
jgi:hypothetical protein